MFILLGVKGYLYGGPEAPGELLGVEVFIEVPKDIVYGTEVRDAPGVDALHFNAQAGAKEVLFVGVEVVVGQAIVFLDRKSVV